MIKKKAVHFDTGQWMEEKAGFHYSDRPTVWAFGLCGSSIDKSQTDRITIDKNLVTCKKCLEKIYGEGSIESKGTYFVCSTYNNNSKMYFDRVSAFERGWSIIEVYDKNGIRIGAYHFTGEKYQLAIFNVGDNGEAENQNTSCEKTD